MLAGFFLPSAMTERTASISAELAAGGPDGSHSASYHLPSAQASTYSSPVSKYLLPLRASAASASSWRLVCDGTGHS